MSVWFVAALMSIVYGLELNLGVEVTETLFSDPTGVAAAILGLIALVTGAITAVNVVQRMIDEL